MVLSSVAIGSDASMTPEWTEPMMNSALVRWIRFRSLRAPLAGLDSVSSVASSTLRPAIPPSLLIRSTAALAALSCHTPHDDIAPVRSQWCPMTIGPELCANASRMIVRLAVPATAPPASAHSRKLRRETFLAMIRHSLRAVELLRQSKIAMHDFRLTLEVMGSAGIDDSALFHHKHVLVELESGFDVLFDQQDRYTALIDAVDFPPD